MFVQFHLTMRAVCFLLRLGLLKEIFLKNVQCWEPLVEAPVGLIRGLRSDDGNYTMFLGIPYGQIGDNPFGVAEPYSIFVNTFNATDDPPACPQMLGDTAIGSLDCLRLNIFAPLPANNSNKLPVLVWIYGGTFNTGFVKYNHFGPTYYVRNNVIYVSFNYRTGPYGFMCLDTPDVPGNQGLKDQLLALRWVKENICSFGGDPNNITVMGESAGGISIDFHLMSKQKKYFNKAIIMSGGAVRPFSIIDADLSVPLKVCQQLGFNTSNVSDALLHLTTVDPKTVMDAYTKKSISLKPCVEKEFENIERFITDYPWNLDVPKVNGVPILIGFNNNEGLIRYYRQPAGYFTKKDYFRNSLENIFNYDNNFSEMESLVRNFYFGDKELTEELKDEVLEFESDYFYGFASPWTARKLLSQGAEKVYLYLFSYDGGKNYIKNKYNIQYKGVAHGDELGYLFEMDNNKIVKNAEYDQLVSDRMVTLWTNFVKYGNPTPGTSNLLPIEWIPITNHTMNYLDINKDLSLKRQLFSDRMAFWDILFKTYKLRI